ncbi:SPBc2 prophage-derived aminoglycoside N(3')-acetyltransferase-like protein YokD [Maioricimonas rarisocia]|uniref:Aminoglycoside N(3)-acetyltransferase n=1 Tax=Maioricimonas rarisocia TaxID=2528026 RepID=A0A517Z0V5_9PLAN|nr:AAC(3) family N-acetyltransferase [Maioricimonas rarisocia]QDU36095.1 SPBc2 prophage-derived aminoglycoside N(3')-acetyltransferase-like protein YokD [Maioricimonas rarisocia]
MLPSLPRPARRMARRLIAATTRPWISRARLAEDLRLLGVRRGGILLVHSSLSALGYLPGGPSAVLGALEDAIGPEGTLVLPTHTWKQANRGSREFDVAGTPSTVGILSETFRRQPGVLRSAHPTHSVAARGPLAAELIRAHEYADTPCGDGTPYCRLFEREGQILLLGVELRRNTCFHAVEALAGVPYLMCDTPEEFRIRDVSGVERSLTIRMHAPARKSRFNEMESLLTETGSLRKGRTGGSISLLLEGRRFRDTMLEQLAANPLFVLAAPGPAQEPPANVPAGI